MKLLLLLLCAIWQASGGGLPYRGVTVGFTPYSAPVHSQFHAQNIYGQYMYGYATDHSIKEEYRTADGVTRGGYSYIDANGILQTVQYISDEHGFRVIATNLPHDLPEVQYARAQHLAAHEHVRAEHAVLHASHERPVIPVALSPLPVPASAPVVPVRSLQLSTHPVVVEEAVAVVPVSSQFHAQDGHGHYTYGYADPLSAKTETKSPDGVTRGGYSYIDAHGVLQTVKYVSDPVNGFRVAATNLPKAPAVTLIGPKVSTTVSGPKEHVDVAPVAIAPQTNVVVASPAPLPVHVPAHGPVEGSVPVYTEQEIIANAHVPVHGTVHGEEHYLQLNPNHAPQHVEGAVINSEANYNLAHAGQDAQFVHQVPQGVAYVDQSHPHHPHVNHHQLGLEEVTYVQPHEAAVHGDYAAPIAGPHLQHAPAYENHGEAVIVDAPQAHEIAYAQPSPIYQQAVLPQRHHEAAYADQVHSPQQATYLDQPQLLHEGAYVAQPHEYNNAGPAEHAGAHHPGAYVHQTYAHPDAHYTQQPQYLDAKQAAQLVEQAQLIDAQQQQHHQQQYFAAKPEGAYVHDDGIQQYAAVAPSLGNEAHYAEVDRSQLIDALPPYRGLLPPLQGPLPYARQHHQPTHPHHQAAHHQHEIHSSPALADHNAALLADHNVGGVPNSLHLNAAHEGYEAGYRPAPVDGNILQQAAHRPTPAEPVYALPETNDGSPELGRVALFVPERHGAQSADGGPVSAYVDHHHADHAAGHGATISEPKITGPTGYYTQNIQY